ncbi:lytic polysaccharide monooxygenase [Pseudoalteromonas sp. OOF1S-7]|uniref:lytic polysaccharide monooxygenase n=1 Tax=Pseudoalteromonas sp. OOF1S-7 TaxID=2917757 RepID=UPI001EF61453|nr:lytic polysaccharide monooxygenase [Pseudoalteromonas sp. OOF1S-7]MCG7535069.1 lytic polysaccharide monooxygenase [Pseudoalteromonas sp. OOF1S-7]
MKYNKTLSALAVGISFAAANQALAHGYMDFPKARQAICQEQGGFWWPKDGSKIPNAACRAAFLKSGHVQFIQKHEFAANTAEFNDQSAVEANIPDGTLCHAGDKNKAGMGLPSKDWQKTPVTVDGQGQIKIRYRATTPHNPSFWQFYLTKPGVDFENKALSWADLELVQSHGNVDFFMAPDGKRYYEMTVAIPDKFSGDAVLYSRWQRDDVVGEGFYNCSDITLIRDAEPQPPQSWHSAGYYLRQGQTVNIGDTVWLRAFDGNGKELIQEKLTISEQRLADWPAYFATQLNEAFAALIRIGVQDAHGNIHFDATNLAGNQVFVSDQAHTFNLSVVARPVNTPPTVHTPAVLTVQEGQSAHLHVHAFDDQQSRLDFDWQLPAQISYTGDGATITVTAPQVDKDTQFSGKVTVSDGQLSTSVNVVIAVTNQNDTPTPPDSDTWQADKVYTGGDIVSFNGSQYRAKWWVRGQRPDNSHAWERIASPSEPKDQWQASVAYTGGAVVRYQGQRYQARWWTRGQQPGKHSVWQKL